MKIEGDTTCPHCKKDHEASFDLDKLEVKPTSPELKNASTSGTTTIQEEKPPKVEIKTVQPQDEPFFACKNGNCGEGVHRNENYSKKPNKKCKNCDSLNGNKKCKNCGNTDVEEFDELDDEELKELGIPIPPESEESHEDHNHE